MSTLVLDIFHLSGHGPARAAFLNADVTDALDRSPGGGTLTEVAAVKRAAVLHRPGWRVIQGSGDMGQRECAIILPASHELLAEYVEEIDPGGGKGRLKSPLCATTVVARDPISGGVYVWSTAHLRAHLEGKLRRLIADGKVLIGVSRKHSRSMTRWSKHIEMVRKEYRADAVIIFPDWNLNGLLVWVRRHIARHFSSDLKPVVPKRGTFKGSRRAIDFPITNMRVVSGPTVHDVVSSNHHKVAVKLSKTISKEPPLKLSEFDVIRIVNAIRPILYEETRKLLEAINSTSERNI